MCLRISRPAAGNVTVPVEDLNAVLAGSGGASTGAGSNATDLIAAPAGTNVTLSLAQLGQVCRGFGFLCSPGLPDVQQGVACGVTPLPLGHLWES